jgi:predicted Fe-Mo cluster-binding NifX family protein
MQVCIASTGRSLSENVYPQFEDAPYYLMVDGDSGPVEAIRNYCRCRPDFNGAQAAQLLADRGAQVMLCGGIQQQCLEVLNDAGIDCREAYPGTGQEALGRLLHEAPPRLRRAASGGRAPIVHSARAIDGEFTFTGRHIEYDDWELLLDIPTPAEAPRNWLEPHDFAHGAYHLRLVVERVGPASLPVDFEFAWLNKPASADPERVHRCSFGHYCSFTQLGTYEHLAMMADMELTSEDGGQYPWDWSSAWDSAFVLVKPYGQQPYPLKVHATVTLYGMASQ